MTKDKERRTVSLSPENDRFLEQTDNASALVDDLVSQYRKTGDRNTTGLELQRKHKQAELEEALDRAERLRREVNELSAVIESTREQQDDQWETAQDALTGVPRDPDNPAIQNWAQKLGVTPARLIERLETEGT